MTSSSNEPYSPEAEEADRQWQQMPAGPEDDGDDDILAPPAAAPEANEADLLEQSLSVNPDEDDEYPHGAAEYAVEEYEE